MMGNKDKEPKPSTFDNFWEQRLSSYPGTQEFQEIYRQMLEELPLPERKLETPAVVSLIGIPGAGKSTFSKLLQEYVPAVHLRSDLIGFLKIPKGPTYDYYKAYVIKHALARHYLEQGYSVIMDDNNRTLYNRERVYRMGQRYGARNILFFLHISIDLALPRVQRRDMEENRGLRFYQTREKLVLFQNQIEPPTPEEIEEWDLLYQEIDASMSLEEIRKVLEANPVIRSLAQK